MSGQCSIQFRSNHGDPNRRYPHLAIRSWERRDSTAWNSKTEHSNAIAARYVIAAIVVCHQATLNELSRTVSESCACTCIDNEAVPNAAAGKPILAESQPSEKLLEIELLGKSPLLLEEGGVSHVTCEQSEKAAVGPKETLTTYPDRFPYRKHWQRVYTTSSASVRLCVRSLESLKSPLTGRRRAQLPDASQCDAKGGLVILGVGER